MTSQRVLAGVTHDIAHHAISCFSYLHPHLYEACQTAGVRESTVELLSVEPYPQELSRVEPLRLALIALHEKFVAILNANKLDLSDVQSAILRFQFPLLGGDGYTCQVQARITSSRGHLYTAVLE